MDGKLCDEGEESDLRATIGLGFKEDEILRLMAAAVLAVIRFARLSLTTF